MFLIQASAFSIYSNYNKNKSDTNKINIDSNWLKKRDKLLKVQDKLLKEEDSLFKIEDSILQMASKNGGKALIIKNNKLVDQSNQMISGNCPDCNPYIDITLIKKLKHLCFISYATGEHLIVYDEKSKAFFNVLNGKYQRINDLGDVDIIYNQVLKLYVIRVNRYLKDITVTLDDISYTSNAPSLIQNYLLGTGTGELNSLENLLNIKSNNSGNGNFEFMSSSISNIKSTILDSAFRNINTTTMLINDKTEVPVFLNTDTITKVINLSPAALHMKGIFAKAIINKNFTLINSKNEKVNAADLKLESTPVNEVDLTNIEIMSFLDELYVFRRKYDSLIENELKAYNDCTDSFKCCGSLINQMSFSDLDLDLFDLERDYSSLKYLLSNNSSKSNDTNSVKQNAVNNNPKPAYSYKINKIDCSNCFNIDSTNSSEKSKSPSKPANNYSEIDSIWSSFKKITQDQLFKLVAFQNNMTSNNLEYSTSPIYPQGDAFSISLNISTLDSAAKLGLPRYISPTSTLSFKVIHKWQFSFSSGLFYAFGSNFKSAIYGFQQVPTIGNTIQTNSPYKLVQSGTASSILGLNAMTNIVYKFTKDFTFGFSIGTGITIESQPRIAYLAGLTSSIGNKQLFHINLGTSLLPINQLKSNYNIGQNIYYATNPGNDIYNKKIELGCFLSLSYTLFNLKTSSKTSSTSANKTASASGKSSGQPSVSFQFNSGSSSNSGSTTTISTGTKTSSSTTNQ